MRSPSHTQCRCIKNGLEFNLCHSGGHDCGNIKPVGQRTEMSLDPRTAWDQSAASGDNEDEPAPVQPVQPRRILRAKSVLAHTVNRTASGLAAQHVPAHQEPLPALFLQSSPPFPKQSHGTLGSKAAMIVVKIHYPLLGLQALVPTSSPLRSPASGTPGAATPLE